MIVYGTKATEVAKEILHDKCAHCGTANSIDLHVFQRYAHIFWIPFFPIGKTAVSQCDHCKQVLKLKQMPPALTNAYDNLKAQVKTPVWTYSGLALVVVLIVIGVISDKNKDERNAKLILAPRSGDVFEIKTKDNQYTLYKVDQVQGDSVLVRINKYESNKITGITGLKSKGDGAYAEEQYALPKSELKAMLEKGEILDIDRQ